MEMSHPAAMLGDLQRIEAALARLARLASPPAPRGAPTQRQLALLRTVDTGLRVTVGEVARRLSLHPSRASRLVQGALGRGLVRRYASQGDGRRVELRLTPRGRKLSRSAAALQQRGVVRALRSFHPPELRQLGLLLTRLAVALETAKGPPTAAAPPGS